MHVVRDTSFLLVFDIFVVVVVFIWRARAAFVNMLGVCVRAEWEGVALPAHAAPPVVAVAVLVESVEKKNIMAAII